MKKNSNKWKIISIVLFSVLILALANPILVSIAEISDQVEWDATKTNLSGITLDGDSDDWNDIPGLSLTLSSLDDSRTVDVEARIAYDATHIAMLYIVHDDYEFAADHDFTAHIAVQWAIDDAAGPHMGADSLGSSTGKVDIWHWEIETLPGNEVGGTATAGDGGNDPGGNLDDEWATSISARYDDGEENSIRGNWNHTGSNGPNGTEGIYYFEMKRPITTTDANDTQFREGKTYKLALAYWDPDESAAGWTDSGHLVSSGYDWIEVAIGVVKPNNTSYFPIFGIFLPVLAYSVLRFNRRK